MGHFLKVQDKLVNKYLTTAFLKDLSNFLCLFFEMIHFQVKSGLALDNMIQL